MQGAPQILQNHGTRDTTHILECATYFTNNAQIRTHQWVRYHGHSYPCPGEHCQRASKFYLSSKIQNNSIRTDIRYIYNLQSKLKTESIFLATCIDVSTRHNTSSILWTTRMWGSPQFPVATKLSMERADSPPAPISHQQKSLNAFKQNHKLWEHFRVQWT